MSLAVPRQERYRQPVDDAACQRRGRLSPGALDGLVADVLQPRQVVDAGSADDAKHGLRHDFSCSTPHSDVRLYCDAIIKHCPSPSRDLDMPTMKDREKRQSIIDA